MRSSKNIVFSKNEMIDREPCRDVHNSSIHSKFIQAQSQSTTLCNRWRNTTHLESYFSYIRGCITRFQGSNMLTNTSHERLLSGLTCIVSNKPLSI